MDIFQAIILGIVQGITEWLPVSSSGHLVIFQHFFRIEQAVAFDLMLHLGSLIVVVIFFWKQIKELFFGVLRFEKKSLEYLAFMILATIPIAIVGYFFKSRIEALFSSLAAVGFALLFTSLLLFMSRYPKEKKGKLDYPKSMIIGIFQAIAILPGVSRSGSTISSGMMLGIKKEDVAQFSFLIFIPAILGAAVIELGNITSFPDVGLMILGTVVSAIVGYFSLKLLMNIIKKDKFSWFSLYCLILGIVVLIVAYA
jgi:undecaprenyl-diphosphatase